LANNVFGGDASARKSALETGAFQQRWPRLRRDDFADPVEVEPVGAILAQRGGWRGMAGTGSEHGGRRRRGTLTPAGR
jgi:hypothetical protein